MVVLSNLEILNANMIENNISQKERLEKLNEIAKNQIEILSSNKNIKELERLENNTKSLIGIKN